jgi:hypothetical protein
MKWEGRKETKIRNVQNKEKMQTRSSESSCRHLKHVQSVAYPSAKTWTVAATSQHSASTWLHLLPEVSAAGNARGDKVWGLQDARQTHICTPTPIKKSLPWRSCKTKNAIVQRACADYTSSATKFVILQWKTRMKTKMPINNKLVEQVRNLHGRLWKPKTSRRVYWSPPPLYPV